MMKRKNLYALFSCLFLSGCGMIDYHPYDVRISGETEVNAHNMERIEANCQGKTTIRFVTMGDSQRWYDETEDFVKAINQRNDIDFVIHGGDMSDFGLTKEFLWQRDIMNGLHVPYVALIGNHDCLGTGAETYKAVFGPTNFSFIAGDVKFVCLNTNALEYDYSEPVPDFTFMENEIEGDFSCFASGADCFAFFGVTVQFLPVILFCILVFLGGIIILFLRCLGAFGVFRCIGFKAFHFVAHSGKSVDDSFIVIVAFVAEGNGRVLFHEPHSLFGKVRCVHFHQASTVGAISATTLTE